ncbi:MAG: hypothetical protein ACRYFW_00900 [Janthinobacterium lividum]
MANDSSDDGLSVAPDAANAGNQERDPRQDAGQDESIQRRLEKDPENVQAQLDNGLDESMDASDPISATLPGSSTEPPASSGFDEDEAAR